MIPFLHISSVPLRELRPISVPVSESALHRAPQPCQPPKGGMVSEWHRAGLDWILGRISFLWRWWGPYRGCPEKMGMPHSCQDDGAWSHLVQWKVSLPWQRVEKRCSLRSLPNLWYSPDWTARTFLEESPFFPFKSALICLSKCLGQWKELAPPNLALSATVLAGLLKAAPLPPFHEKHRSDNASRTSHGRSSEQQWHAALMPLKQKTTPSQACIVKGSPGICTSLETTHQPQDFWGWEGKCSRRVWPLAQCRGKRGELSADRTMKCTAIISNFTLRSYQNTTKISLKM